MYNRGHTRGFGLMEIIISITLISVSLFAFATVSRIAFRAVLESSDRQRGGFLLEEGFESIKTMRDDGWANISSLTLDMPYHLIFSEGTWSATISSQLIDGIFTRTFILREVFRDTSDNIASSGTSDPDARRMEIKVTWEERGDERTMSAVSYITNIFLE